ncbi:MAG: hypothetical protein KF723_23085 [Rhizobiaceae bacterium]|nr:hypothetical protein [Rhizobiaceae bacterium]
MARMTDDEIRDMVSMAAFQDVVQRAFIAVLVSGREVTRDAVWAAASFSMPADFPEPAKQAMQASMDATFAMARSLSPKRASPPSKPTK